MKKLFFILALITLGCTNVYALEHENKMDSYILKHGGDLQTRMTNEQLSKERLAAIQSSEKSLFLPRGGGSYRTLNGTYPNYQQELWYWCGPATIKQAVQYLNGSSASQSTYASHMGTNSTDGTYVYKMRDEMNYRQSVHNYIYTNAATFSNEWDL